MGRPVSEAEASAHGAAVLDALRGAAMAAAPCPLNEDLANALLGDFTVSYASTLVARLEARGAIKVQRTGRARRVTILAEGMGQGLTTNWTRGARSRAIDAVLDDLAELVAEGMAVNAAGARLGFSASRTWQLWAKIRESKGYQAQ